MLNFSSSWTCGKGVSPQFKEPNTYGHVVATPLRPASFPTTTPSPARRLGPDLFNVGHESGFHPSLWPLRRETLNIL